MNEQNKEKHDIFISYSTKNKNVADAIVADFEQNGIKCWYAPRDILPGEEWVTAITNALESAKALVLIYTDESNNSRQVMNEIAVAFNAGITIVPFRLSEEAMSSELEYYLTRVHWLDGVTKPLKENIEALREYVDVILKAPESIASTHKRTKANHSGNTGNKSVAGIIIAAVLIIAALVIGVVAGGAYAAKLSEDNREEASEEDKKDKKDKENNEDSDEEDSEDESEDTDYYATAEAYLLNGDYGNAFVYFEKAEAEGSLEAMAALGNMYYDGLGVEMDEATALEYYLKASGYTKNDDGRIIKDPDGISDEEILNRMGLIFFYNGQYDDAAFFFEEDVALFENVTAMGNAALAYDYEGEYDKALAMYGSAIDAGHREANNYKQRIAEMAEDGLISEADAEKWLE